MAEQQLRQDKHGMYYWADPEPEQTVEPAAPVVVPAVEPAAPVVVPAVEPAAPAKRTRSPRKAVPAAVPVTDAVTIPPPPPIMRG